MMNDVSVEKTALNQSENILDNSEKIEEEMKESSNINSTEIEDVVSIKKETTITNSTVDISKNEKDGNDCNYWWLVAQPEDRIKDGKEIKGWSFNNIGDGDTVDFDSKSYVRREDTKITFERNKKYFAQLHENDKFIGFEVGSVQSIVALGVCIENNLKKDVAVFKKEKTLKVPIKRIEFEKCNKLKDMSFLKNPQGTLFPLSKVEYKFIMSIICGKNPDIQNESVSNPDTRDTLIEDNNNETEKLTKNLILYGPPGTGKTFDTVTYAVAICMRKTKEELEELNEFKDTSGKVDHAKIFDKYEELRKKGRIKFITFHQSYGYEEFIEGIKPKLEIDNKTELQYEIKDGSFKAFCKKANPSCICKNSTDSVNTDRQSELEPYVFIIDEINRGNISKIFGELITLIEPNKRLGAKETRWATLPYSGDDFSVPNNVYILGTMNTADRSLALMDTALRRRFNFIEMIPDYKVLNENITIDGQDLKLQLMLQTINNRIECLYDKEHTIGHGYFIKLNKQENQTKDILKEIFKEKVIPLLQEYFYDDYSKIQLVLGDNQKDINNRFIKNEPYDVSALFGTGLEIDKQDQYELNNEAFDDINRYIGIYAVKKTKNQTENNEQIPDA